MKYDFDTVTDRRNTDSVKWNIPENQLPMWVADMDFKAAPKIIETLEERVRHGIFGYTDITDKWYDAYINWWNRRHGLLMSKESLFFCTGVVPAISSIVRKLTTPNEKVLIQTPVYNIFFNSIINNGCRVWENKLKYENGAYSMDFEDLEMKLSDPQTTLMILCNPHNPTGRIWTREELKTVGDLCARYNVTVISDEIHCDITEPGKGYIPFASVSETCERISVTCIAPTKTFNLAGLQTAAVYVKEPFLRHKVWRAINTDEVAEPNAFAAAAAICAFNECEDWALEMNSYVFRNRRIAEDFIRENIPDASTVHGEATYLLWIDISKIGKSSEISSFLKKNADLFVTAGSVYGENGEGFLRMNVACPEVLLRDGLRRFRDGIEMFRDKKGQT